MKAFNHVNAKSLEEVRTALADGKTELIAGGTDLMGTLKDNLLRTYPANVVNLKSVPGLDFIKEEGGMLKIGATTRLGDIAAHPVVKEKYTALSQAASRVATPHAARWGPSGAPCAAAPLLVFPEAGKPLRLQAQGGREVFRHVRGQPLPFDFRGGGELHSGAPERHGPGSDCAQRPGGDHQPDDRGGKLF